MNAVAAGARNLGRMLVPRQEQAPPSERMMGLDQVIEMFNYAGVNYPQLGFQQTLTGNTEEILPDYNGLAHGAYRANAIVGACLRVRMRHFSEVRFQFQQLSGGRPGNLFGTGELGILERPWPNGTTGDLLTRMIQDVDLAGNSFTVGANRTGHLLDGGTISTGDQLFQLRPDWVQIILGSNKRRESWMIGEPDTAVLGYHYTPGGKGVGDPIVFRPEDVAHFAPERDPNAMFRGLSWLTSLIREVMADQAMTAHKLKFLQQGATVNMVVKLPAQTKDLFDAVVQKFREGHEGLGNAYRTLFLSAGADVVPVGTNLQQMDFSTVQGSGELRIASAARVPPVMLGLREGLQGSSLNSGNYQANRRMFADGEIRPLWRQAAGALETIINIPPGGARLWYDDRDVSFLKEDVKDAAEVQQMNAASIRQLIDSGFKPDTAVDAVVSGDYSRLIHSGMFSVQLQDPSVAMTKPTLKGQLIPTKPGTNGNSTSPPVPAQSGQN